MRDSGKQIDPLGPFARVFFASVRSEPDGTSGGLCTWKYGELLWASGAEVEWLRAEPEAGIDSVNPALMNRVGEGVWRRVAELQRNMKESGGRVRVMANKVDALAAYGTGFPPGEWVKVAAWRRALANCDHGGGRRLVVMFGAGMDFTPHMAAASMRLKAPWVANYHDPYPGHLYPAPYRWKRSIPGFHQERWHRRIIERASALSFPSRRLRDWILCGDLEQHRGKAFILPHLAIGPAMEELEDDSLLPEGFEPGGFHIVHTGTMLRHRSPWALLEGFRHFAGEDEERRRRARLWLVGRVDRHLRADGRWGELTAHEAIRVVMQRVPYLRAMALAHRSAASVIVEAVAEESPFYPAKLADILYLRKPALAITPKRSTVRDMLGDEYPLLCPPADPGAVADRLERLWGAWKAGSLAAFEPPERAVEMASAEAALREIGRMVEFFRERRLL